jgi:hypothetical protein
MSSDELTRLGEIFRELGARDPEGWARSQVEHGIPQLARFLFLRQAWSMVIAEGDVKWIADAVERSKADPRAPYSGVGMALERLLARGVELEDVTEVVRGMQAELLFYFCYLLEDPGDVPASVADLSWALVRLDEEDQVVERIHSLHESVLDTDPTGREMRPRRPVDPSVG